MAHKRKTRRPPTGRQHSMGNVFSVTVSELGSRDARYKSLGEALRALRSAYPKAIISRWGKLHMTTGFGEVFSYRVAKWSRTPHSRTQAGWSRNYDGKIVVYYTAEPVSEHDYLRHKIFDSGEY